MRHPLHSLVPGILSKAGIAPLDGMVYLEDVLGTINPLWQAIVFLIARLLPWALLCRYLVPARRADDTATIVFSSGSTGVPKGVMLSHGNIVANIDAIQRVFEFTSTDSIPTLGTGKVDLRAVHQLAAARSLQPH